MPININREPRDKEYRKLMEYAFKVCETFILSMQNQILIHYPEPEILRMLESYKIDEGRAIYYPNIDYYNPDAVFYFYKCNEESKSIIMETVNGLYDWGYQTLPGDLTFLDAKGDVWMSSKSHEDMAFINETNRNEVEFIKNHLGLEFYWREKISLAIKEVFYE